MAVAAATAVFAMPNHEMPRPSRVDRAWGKGTPTFGPKPARDQKRLLFTRDLDVARQRLAHRTFKGSKQAKRAAKRGGNPARSRLPRLCGHAFRIPAQVCGRCGMTKHAIVNARAEFCAGR